MIKLNTLLKIFIFIALLASTLPTFAQDKDTDEMKKFMSEVKADKKILILSYMELTDDQKKQFTPIYDEYQAELQKLNERIANLIKSYASYYTNYAVTDDVSAKLITEMLSIESREAEVKSEISKKLLAVIPAMKVARYIQMENKIRAAIKYELAVQIPLAQ